MAVAQPNPTLQKIRQPLSLVHARTLGGSHSDKRSIAMHAELLMRDYYYKRDDFSGTLDAAFWTATNTGASSAAPVFAAARHGVCRFTTGGGNPGVSMLYGTNLIFQADDNPVMIARFKMPAAVTNLVMHIGWANVLTTKTTTPVSGQGAISSGATTPTITNGLTDGAMFSIDTSLTLATAALNGVGTSTAAAGVPIGTYTPTASKYIDLIVGCGVGVGYCEVYDNDQMIGQFSVASGPDTAVALFPYFFVKDLGTSKVLDLDCVAFITERNAR